jgi:hypothetical protein
MKSFKLFSLVVLMFVGFSAAILIAQDKETAKSKLDDVKGKVEKLTIKVDGKDVVFDGKDAESLVKKLKSSKSSYVFSTDGDEEITHPGKGKVMVIKSQSGKALGVKKDGDQKKVKVEVEDGKKKITVTTTKDGKEETKIYEGEEAEKFLKEEKDNVKVKVWTEEDCEEGEGDVVFFNKRVGGGGCDCNCCCGGHKMMGKGMGKGMMMMKKFPGKNMKHKIIKEIDEEDEIKDKAEKKIEMKVEKKTEKK